MRPLAVVTLLLFAAACAPTPARKSVNDIDIDSLLAYQVQLLGERKVLLTKSSLVPAGQSDTSFVPTPSDWRQELEVFGVLGAFTHKLYQDTYQVEDSVDDPLSNLTIRRYTNEQAPLRVLTVYYRDNLSRIRQVTGLVQETNPLYTTSRRLTMQFEELNGRPALSSYSIDGYQKLALRDTVRFAVRGLLHW